jgi:hypothetical protein
VHNHAHEKRNTHTQKRTHAHEKRNTHTQKRTHRKTKSRPRMAWRLQPYPKQKHIKTSPHNKEEEEENIMGETTT